MNIKSPELPILTFARPVAAGHNKPPMGNHDPAELGPERSGGQGLDRNQFESGDRAILALLKNTRAADETDLVATFRDDAYEVWSRRGMVRFKRYTHPGGTLRFKVVEQIGENPVANQDPFAIASSRSRRLAPKTSLPPRRESCRAAASPNPLLAPVMTITLSLMLSVMLFFLVTTYP